MYLEMIANVAHIGSAEQRVADGMYKHVGIAVAKQSHTVFYLYTSEPQFAALNESVYIKSKSGSNLHNSLFYFCINLQYNDVKQKVAWARYFGLMRLFVFRLPSVYLRNRSLRPSMSNPRVKRSVWSSGLLFAVAIT